MSSPSIIAPPSPRSIIAGDDIVISNGNYTQHEGSACNRGNLNNNSDNNSSSKNIMYIFQLAFLIVFYRRRGVSSIGTATIALYKVSEANNNIQSLFEVNNC